MGNYFFDSCVVIEILKSNPKFDKYKDEIKTFTIFNLGEIFNYLVQNIEYQKAVQIYYKLNSFVHQISNEVLIEAIKFRVEHNAKLRKKQKPLSYADAIGYIYSKQNNLKFLTCDDQFIGLTNAEHLKK